MIVQSQTAILSPFPSTSFSQVKLRSFSAVLSVFTIKLDSGVGMVQVHQLLVHHIRSLLLVVAAGILLAGCIEQSTTPVVFDQVLESTTFDNRLLTPVVIFRDNAVLDTLPATTSKTYALGRKGVVTHAWQIIAPRDIYGLPAGIEPRVTIGVQYPVRATYTIDNDAISGHTIFTPRIANLSQWNLRLTANYSESDQFATNYVIYSNSNTPLDHAPYYYWNSSSNVLLTATNGFGSYLIERSDTVESRRLVLDDASSFRGSGVSKPIFLY
jgi:hypothetical protein